MAQNNTNPWMQSAANHAKNIIRNEIYNIAYHQGDPCITLDALDNELQDRLFSQKINRPIVNTMNEIVSIVQDELYSYSSARNRVMVPVNSPDWLMNFLQSELNQLLDDALLESIKLHIEMLSQIGLALGKELYNNIGVALYDDSFQTELGLSEKSSSVLGDVYSINGTVNTMPWTIYSKDYQLWIIDIDVLNSMKERG